MITLGNLSDFVELLVNAYILLKVVYNLGRLRERMEKALASVKNKSDQN